MKILATHHQLHHYGGDASIVPGTGGLESCVTSTRLCTVLLRKGGELLQHLGPALAQVRQEAGVTRGRLVRARMCMVITHLIAEVAMVFTITDSDMSSLS